ncbi:MAG TPA: hypothetical protein VN083_07865, partial [Vicinamibacteria bacterium]|nr:hypothetical protein [Vicinamibacteria bacterium]
PGHACLEGRPDGLKILATSLSDARGIPIPPEGGASKNVWVVGVGLSLAALVLRGIVPPPAAPFLPPAALSIGALVSLGLLGAFGARFEPVDAPVHRDPGVRVLVAVLGLFLGILLSHNDRITSDGVDHFVYLRSLWIDHDLDLANDYAALSPRGHSVDPPTPLGRTGNLHPIGPALVWTPFYLLADGLCRVVGRVPDGQNELYRNAVAIAGLLSGWVGLVFLYRTASLRTGRGAALLATLGVGCGTFLFWYLAFAPTMAHAPGFCAVAVVLFLWLHEEPWGTKRAALLGAAIGAAALMRWTNVLLLVLPAVSLALRLFRGGARREVLQEGAVLLVAAIALFSPQMIVWKLLYGSFLTIPQGPAFLARSPAFGGVLFSPWHGLFSWSPILYLGALGLVLLCRQEPQKGAAILLFLVGLLRVNASAADWWGGAAFGARRFDSALPFLGLGLAWTCTSLARFGRRHPLALPTILAGALVFWNLALAAGYRSGRWD